MQFINGEWREGGGENFASFNPATGEIVWQGRGATQQECEGALVAAQSAFKQWRRLPIGTRIEYLNLFANRLQKERASFTEIISQETGKPLWEAHLEVDSMIQKSCDLR